MPANTASAPKAVSPLKASKRQSPPIKPGSKKFKPIIITLILLLGAGITAALHFKWVDLQVLDAKFGLSKLPYVGRFITPALDVAANIASEEIMPQPQVPPAVQTQRSTSTQIADNQSTVNPPDDSEIKKLASAKQEEEQKRLVKVSRLYDAMKPEEAAPILSEMDDERIVIIFSKMDQERVAKILTLLEPRRSARLSGLMLIGRPEN